MNKKILIIVGILVIVISLIFIFLPSKKETKKIPVQMPAPVTGGAVPNNYYWTQKTREDSRNSYAVGVLIGKLPYQGTNFSMFYDIKKDIFTVILNSENVAAANKEFDVFLSDNNVQDRSWVLNLVIKREVLHP